MPLPVGDAYRRQIAAGGGARGNKPIPPMLPGEWKPGMPCHWTEQTNFYFWKCRLIRFFTLVSLSAGAAYLVFRAMFTIGVFTLHPALMGYQIFFYVLEILSLSALLFRFFELWNITNRNSVDFKRLPNELISTNFAYGRREDVRPEHSNYPSVAVFIPCYNESAELVLETALGAVAIDYPSELLSVYLCDDGQDDMKRNMIAQLRCQYQNLFYVTRPEHSHAKAGNLNYALERTRSDLVVTLDADFVARPNLLQRLLSYYYVWNPLTELYEFNDSLAVVQTPQHFRNLSPYDNDPLDQRSTFFFETVLPGKDWWNASTMIGTTNLLNRVPLTEAGFYPYHSITEDTAMSLVFHSLGYRTYYVNESLASGLATTSLHSNIGQRSRWLKGDYQILFNWKYSPLTASGLSLIQRFLYMHMTFSRIISIVHFFYDVMTVMLLVFAISPLDAPDPVMFICFFGAYMVSTVVLRSVVVAGGQGLDKSESGSVAFEAIFRYPTLKGLFKAIFVGKKLEFKVTDKSGAKSNTRKLEELRRQRPDRISRGDMNGNDGDLGAMDESDMDNGSAVVTESIVTDSSAEENNLQEVALPVAPEADEEDKIEVSHVDMSRASMTRTSMTMSRASMSQFGDSDRSHTNFSHDNGSSSDDESLYVGHSKSYFKQSAEERKTRRHDVRKNLKRLWFNVLSFVVLLFAIIWAFINPPIDPVTGRSNGTPSAELLQTKRESGLLQVSMAIGFAIMNLLPHMMAIYLCFIPYVSGWMMTDLVHGRCDQYAVHPRTGKLFVPWSFISLLSVAKVIIMLGALAALGVFIFVKKSV